MDAVTGGSALSPLPLAGGRRRRSHRHHKSAKKVSARTIRKTLRKLGMRPKGRVVLKGGEGEAAAPAPPPASAPAGGRRRRSASASRRSASLRLTNPLKALGL